MALIKCPECGKDVSDRAKTCIHCGYPLKNGFNYTCCATGEIDVDRMLTERLCQKGLEERGWRRFGLDSIFR